MQPQFSHKHASAQNHDHFWHRVDRVRQAPCWIWTGAVDRDGYGRFRFKGTYYRAHRYAFELANGTLPAVVRHTCDCRNCVNPDHLIGGTQRQNMRDKISRGRQARGSQNGRSKLTEYDVLLIKEHLADGCLSQAAIGRLFGVSHSVIRDIKHGRTWTHV